jgi:hypothetical protein
MGRTSESEHQRPFGVPCNVAKSGAAVLTLASAPGIVKQSSQALIDASNAHAGHAGRPMIAFVQWLQGSPWSLAVRQTSWLIPLMQTLHILANGLVLSVIIMIDLRVWRRAGAEPLSDRVRRLLPWLWTALAVLTATGLVLVLSTPRRTLLDTTFQVKMVIMAVAIVATVALGMLLRRIAPEPATTGRMTSIVASVAGAATLLLWLGATIAGRGRWIANVIG